MRGRALVAGVASTLALASPAPAALVGDLRPVVSGLDTPWEVLPLADGRTLVAERPGRIRVLDADDVLAPDPVYTDATARKFLGLVPHPDFVVNRWLYLYVSRTSGSSVVRLRDTGSSLVVDREIFAGPIPTDGNHDGGRMAFGPDGMLYVTTGDIHKPELPQDLQSLNGKILRMDPGGAPPPDNPFFAEGGNARWVWSYGHRHPQGLAFDPSGRLWETEHGPSGEQYGTSYPGGDNRCCRDELNLIVRGGNYGWPLVSGADNLPGMIAPVAHAGSVSAWAPGGLTWVPDETLYAPLLAGTQLRAFTPLGGCVSQQALYDDVYGRLRTAAYDAGRNALWVAADGASATVYRVPVDLGGRTATPCEGFPATAAGPVPATTLPAGEPSSATLAGSPARGAAVDPAIAARPRLRALALRLGRRARALGARRLAARRPLVLRVAGLPPGVLTVRLARPVAGRIVGLARARTRTADTTRVRLRLRRGAARRLPRTGFRLVVTAVVDAQPGGTARSTRILRIPAR